MVTKITKQDWMAFAARLATHRLIAMPVLPYTADSVRPHDEEAARFVAKIEQNYKDLCVDLLEYQKYIRYRLGVDYETNLP